MAGGLPPCAWAALSELTLLWEGELRSQQEGHEGQAQEQRDQLVRLASLFASAERNKDMVNKFKTKLSNNTTGG